MVRDTVQLSD